jgi:hypothetical protein
VPGVIARAQLMYAAIVAAIAMFPAPSVSMAAFLLLLQDLESAQIASRAGKGLAAMRNVKRDLLWTAMESLRVYVQGLADLAGVENSIALIQAAGLVVAQTGAYAKPVLQAKLVAATGLVELIANATILVGKGSKKKVTFNWQWSSNGQSWNNATSTAYAKTTIANLGPGTYLFRVSVLIGETVGEWTQSVSLTLH